MIAPHSKSLSVTNRSGGLLEKVRRYSNIRLSFVTGWQRNVIERLWKLIAPIDIQFAVRFSTELVEMQVVRDGNNEMASRHRVHAGITFQYCVEDEPSPILRLRTIHEFTRNGTKKTGGR